VEFRRGRCFILHLYLLRFDQRFSAGIGEEDKLIEGEDEAMPGQGLSRDAPDHPA